MDEKVIRYDFEIGARVEVLGMDRTGYVQAVALFRDGVNYSVRFIGKRTGHWYHSSEVTPAE